MTGHSPAIKLWIEHDDEEIPLRQVAPSFVNPAEPGALDHIPRHHPVTVVVEIDGWQHRRSARVVNDPLGNDDEIAIVDADQ